MIPQRLLDRDCRVDARARRLERGEDAVAGRLDDVPTPLLDELTQHVVVPAQEPLPGEVTEPFGQGRRAHDIGEQNCHCCCFSHGECPALRISQRTAINGRFLAALDKVLPLDRTA
jgi:hypothetical protein